MLGWLLIFNTLIAGLITSFINAKLLEPITRLSKAMKEVSRGDFEQHLETNSRIAEVGESYQSFNADMTVENKSASQIAPVRQDRIRNPFSFFCSIIFLICRAAYLCLAGF